MRVVPNAAETQQQTACARLSDISGLELWLARPKEKDIAMKSKNSQSGIQNQVVRNLVVTICVVLLAPGDVGLFASSAQENAASTGQAAKIPPDQLDALVAPIALYPDPMLAQVLAASTYPLEIVQLQQWLEKNKNLKDKALSDAVAKQPWDASVQGLAGLPDAVKLLANDLQWTTDLGNAFLAQQSDVMDAVQRMRKKAQDKGNLKSTEQQKVETKVVENKQVIVVEQANPQVVYVPSYNPTVVYGPPVYPYPPITYPPPGYYAAGMAISFGVGVAMGAMWGGGWGYGCGWGGNNDITINTNNNFNRNTNVNGGNRTNVSGGNRANVGTGGGNRGGNAGTWQHNPQHRGGAPYKDKATANRYGGTARGDSMANRQANARQQVSRQGGDLASNRGGGAGASNRAAGGGAGGSNRAAGGGAGVSNRAAGGAGGSDRAAGGGAGNRAGGGDRVGNRSVSSGGSRNSSAFGGGGDGFSGSSARASSSRGSSSMGGGGGGGGRRGGGGGGGGRRR
jgi:hypothetical protein